MTSPLREKALPPGPAQLTAEVHALLRRTLPIVEAEADRIVLRGPVNPGAASPTLLLVTSPALVFAALGLVCVVFLGPGWIGETLADLPATFGLLPIVSLLPVVVAIVSTR